MQTRFSSLVTIKKSAMHKSEKFVEQKNSDLSSAHLALQTSYDSLTNIAVPESGAMTNLLASRSLLSSARNLIQKNREWITFAEQQLQIAKDQLKKDMIEYEKFKYLETQEIKKIIKEIQVAEAKELDEVALMTYSRKTKLESY